MTYNDVMFNVLVTAVAQKQIKGLSRNNKVQVLRAVVKLEQWPDVAQVKKLQGLNGYRIRAGNYRVFFTVDARAGKIRVTQVKSRGSAY